MFSHFVESPYIHVVTTPIFLPILTLGITQSCVSDEDLTDRPSCGSQAPEHHALRVQGRQGPKNNSVFVDLLETINCIQMTVSCRYKPDVGIPRLSSISVQSGSSKPGSGAVAGKGAGRNPV